MAEDAAKAVPLAAGESSVKDTFILSLAKLLEPGDDANPEDQMQTMARLMASHASEIAPILSESDNLAIILGFLDLGQSIRLRSQATLITAKFLEVAKDHGQAMIRDYVTVKISKHTNDDLVTAFSVAASVFPITSDAASALFLQPGFIDDLIGVVRKSVSTRLRHSALELLSAACINKDCRAGIKTGCTPWLEDVVRDKPNDTDANMAALVLVKVSQEAGSYASDEVMSLFKESIALRGPTIIQTAVEGLAYSSTRSDIKEQIAKDTTLLKRIVQILSDTAQQGPLTFGGLTIFYNLTVYQTDMSTEQKKMAQLKAYANQTKLAEPSPLDNASHVTARATKLMEVEVMPLLVKTAKHASPTVLDLIASIALNLTKERKHCGKAIQQGILDVLLPITVYQGRDATLVRARASAAQAMARVLLPVDPTLLFYNQNLPKAKSVATAIQAFKLLLDEQDNQDPRPAFEALQALTNLASMGEEVSQFIVETCFSSVEHYLASTRSAQQQAAIELISNLTTFEACCKLFTVLGTADPTYPSTYDGTTDQAHLPESRFLQVRALTEDVSRGTRLAAMATIFNITQRKEGTRMLLKAPSGLERLLPCLRATRPPESDRPDFDMRARTAGTVANLLENDKLNASTQLKKLDIESRLWESMESDTSSQVSGFAEEALNLLKGS